MTIILLKNTRIPCTHPPNTLQHTATHSPLRTMHASSQHTATHCNTLQHTATHCNTRKNPLHAMHPSSQHTATHSRTQCVPCAHLPNLYYTCSALHQGRAHISLSLSLSLSRRVRIHVLWLIKKVKRGPHDEHPSHEPTKSHGVSLEVKRFGKKLQDRHLLIKSAWHSEWVTSRNQEDLIFLETLPNAVTCTHTRTRIHTLSHTHSQPS